MEENNFVYDGLLCGDYCAQTVYRSDFRCAHLRSKSDIAERYSPRLLKVCKRVFSSLKGQQTCDGLLAAILLVYLHVTSHVVLEVMNYSFSAPGTNEYRIHTGVLAMPM